MAAVPGSPVEREPAKIVAPTVGPPRQVVAEITEIGWANTIQRKSVSRIRFTLNFWSIMARGHFFHSRK
jgi:hypothetical protein